MFPASLNIFHRVRVKENFFSEIFFRQRQRTHCFSPIDRKNKFRQTYPERYRRKTLRYYPFCSFRLFSACIISRLFQYAAFACRFFPKLCRSRLFFFCFRRNVFTPGFPRLRRQHFFPVAKSVYIVREKREKADYHG